MHQTNKHLYHVWHGRILLTCVSRDVHSILQNIDRSLFGQRISPVLQRILLVFLFHATNTHLNVQRAYDGQKTNASKRRRVPTSHDFAVLFGECLQSISV